MPFGKKNMESNCKISKKPIRDWICPRCRHNIRIYENYCPICGLELDWIDTESIAERKIEVPKYQVVPQGITTGTPIPEPNITITC